MSNNDHTARPEQWDDAGAFASDTRACLLELRARVERLEQAQQQGPTVKDPLTLHPPSELRAKWRSEAPRNRDAGVSREDYLMDRAAEWGAEQAQQQGQPATTERPRWSEGICGDGAAILRDGVMVPVEQVIARLNQAEAALEQAQQQPAPSTPAGQGELVRSVALAIGQDGDAIMWKPEARRAILAVADWQSGMGREFSADALRREVGR